MKTHNLLVRSKDFEDIVAGIKTFEVRYNDKGFEVGDILVLEEIDKKGYTGRYIKAEVIYILNDPDYIFGEYVALGMKLRLDKGACL